MAYHTHETGYHAPWLREVMGGVNPRLCALPPHLILETLLYKLRAFCNAGFRAAVVISGHHGSQEDLRGVSRAFAEAFGFSIFLRTDPELVADRYVGDRAGRYELSQMLSIRSDLVAMDHASYASSDPLGRFAQNPDVSETTAEYGIEILDAQIAPIGEAVASFVIDQAFPNRSISMREVEHVWETIEARKMEWATMSP